MSSIEPVFMFDEVRIISDLSEPLIHGKGKAIPGQAHMGPGD
jgi:hypothetical protein